MPSIIPLQGRDFCDRVLLEFLNLTGEPYEYRSIRGSVPGFDGEMLVIRLLCHMNRGRGALVHAFDDWKAIAGFTGISIQGAQAFGGRLHAPPLQPLIMAQYRPRIRLYLFNEGGRERWGDRVDRFDPLVLAIAGGLGAAWTEFVNSINVPGLFWYPPFARWPSPPRSAMIPNAPCVLKSLHHVPGAVTAVRLKQCMLTLWAKADHFGLNHGNLVIEALAVHLEREIVKWMNSQMVANVVGHGPVLVPNSPVTGGIVLFGHHLAN